MNIFLKTVTNFHLENVPDSRVSHRWVVVEWGIYEWVVLLWILGWLGWGLGTAWVWLMGLL